MVRSHDAPAGCSPLGERSDVQQKSTFSSGVDTDHPRAACDHWGASASMED